MCLQGLHHLKWLAPFAPIYGCWNNSKAVSESDVLASSREAGRGSHPCTELGPRSKGQLSRCRD